MYLQDQNILLKRQKGKPFKYQIVRLTTKDIAQTSYISNLAMSIHKNVFTEQEMLEKFSPQKYQRAFNNPLALFYGAFEQEKMQGFCGGGFLKNPNAEGAILTELFVHPDYQRQGIGRELLRVFEPFLFEKKDRIWIEAVSAELEFYLKMGYKVKENVPHLNPNIVFIEKQKPP
jgi:GNAT superfamily N-acetyltransferase